MILHASERGEGAPVALLHGLYGQASNFGALQRRLARGRRVIALDLRNHGSSPHTQAMSYPEMAEDVLETLRALRALPCALVGHSMGGKVAMRAALAAPAEVSRLLVADIAPVAYDHAAFHARYVAAMRAVPLRPGLTRAEADAALAEAVPDKATRGFLLLSLRLGAEPAWRLGLDGIGPSLPALAGWTPPQDPPYQGPALFVAGGRSDFVLPAYRDAILALFPAARVLTLTNAGHWVHTDDFDGFASAAEGFIPAA